MAIIHETVLTRKLIKRTHKEPKSFSHFERMYENLSGRNLALEQKMRTSLPSGFIRINKIKAHETAKYLSGLIKTNKGKGTLILAPLGAGLIPGEFTKGFFKVIAPKARVSLLVTPKSDYVGYEPAQNNPTPRKWIRSNSVESRQQLRLLQKNLAEHLKRCVKPTDKKIIIFDDHVFGRTEWIIRKTLNKNLQFKDIPVLAVQNYDVGIFIGESYMGGKGHGVHWLEQGRKSSNGEMWADNFNYSRSKYTREDEKSPAELVQKFYKSRSQKLVFDRRFAYNLGIVVAKEYLSSKQKKL